MDDDDDDEEEEKGEGEEEEKGEEEKEEAEEQQPQPGTTTQSSPEPQWDAESEPPDPTTQEANRRLNPNIDRSAIRTGDTAEDKLHFQLRVINREGQQVIKEYNWDRDYDRHE